MIFIVHKLQKFVLCLKKILNLTKFLYLFKHKLKFLTFTQRVVFEIAL